MISSAALKIEEAVAVGLNCLEQGLDDKATVKRNILDAISQNCLTASECNEIEDLSVEAFSLLHEYLNIDIDVHDGRITGAAIGSMEFVREESTNERLYRRKGIGDCNVHNKQQNDNKRCS